MKMLLFAASTRLTSWCRQLCDASQNGFESSEHVLVLYRQVVIAGGWRMDGKPWLKEPLTLEDGSTEVSPFVILNA